MKPMFATSQVTDSNQVLQAIFAAAAVGAAIFPGVPLLFEGARMILVQPLALAALAGGMVLTGIVFILAACAWALCIACLGGPVWWVFHALGLRNWPWALLAGAGVLAGFTMIEERLDDPVNNGPADLIQSCGGGVLMVAAALGAALGYLIWRIAYRPVQTSVA